MPNPPIAAVQWRRVSMKYLAAELIGSGLWALILGIAVAVMISLEVPWYGWIWPAALAAMALASMVLDVFRVRAIGWALREDDFLVKRGVLFRRVVAVPYGRMQLVDVKQGPIMRMLGLASVHLVTAAAMSQAALPGLERAEADRLRDHLVRVAETRRAGL